MPPPLILLLRDGPGEYAAALSPHTVTAVPVLACDPLHPPTLPPLLSALPPPPYALAVTSARGATALISAVSTLPPSARARLLAGRGVWGVGPATCGALSALGELAGEEGSPSIHGAGAGCAAELGALIAARPPPGVLFVAGSGAGTGLQDALPGVPVTRVDAYTTAPRPPHVIEQELAAALQGHPAGAPLVAVWYSPSGVSAVVSASAAGGPASTRLLDGVHIAVGRTTAAALAGAGVGGRVGVAEAPTPDGVAGALLRVLVTDAGGGGAG